MIEFSDETRVTRGHAAPFWHMAASAHAVSTPFWNAGFVTAMAAFGAATEVGGGARRGFAPRLVATQGALFDVSELSLEQIDAAQADWSDLAARALEPNIFYAPGFALSAARHFPLRDRPRFIAVWDRRGADRRLVGLFPIASNPLLGDGFIRLWLHKQAALATPLVDRDAASDVIAAFLGWIETRSAAAGVVFARIQEDGRFHRALRAATAQDDRATKILDSYQRAALFAGEAAETIVGEIGSSNRLSQLRRQRRRLDEMGRVTLQEDVAVQDVRRAAEEFLALEAAGWKAARGALLSQASLATFFRSATRLLARDGQCRIVSLRLDGRPLAMMVMLEAQNRGFCWKIAYDEAFRSQAPGIQLFFEQTRAQLARPDIEVTDSCAVADHPMIDRLWRDRVRVCDVAAQLQQGRARDFHSNCRRDATRRSLREFAKRAAHRVLNRRVV